MVPRREREAKSKAEGGFLFYGHGVSDPTKLGGRNTFTTEQFFLLRTCWAYHLAGSDDAAFFLLLPLLGPRLLHTQTQGDALYGQTR